MEVTVKVDTIEEMEKIAKLAGELGIGKDNLKCSMTLSPSIVDKNKADDSVVSNDLLTIPYLTGEKIYLAPFTRRHLESEQYYRWMNSLKITSQFGMIEYLMPVSSKQLEAYYSTNAFSGHSILFAVHEKQSDKFIGTSKLGHLNWVSRCAEFGRVIGEKDMRSKGYGTEIIKLILEYAFLILNLNKVVAGTSVENIAALKTYEKFGFKIEGTIRKSWYKDGKLVDTIRVGLLKEEWDEK